jgi:hypothetical protein
MKKIVEYRKLLNVDKTAELKDLKPFIAMRWKNRILINFRGWSWFKKTEENSKKIIEAYHFLVSINPETIKQNLPEYTETISSSTITDYKFVEGDWLLIFLTEVYMSISVPKATYVKMVNCRFTWSFC